MLKIYLLGKNPSSCTLIICERVTAVQGSEDKTGQDTWELLSYEEHGMERPRPRPPPPEAQTPPAGSLVPGTAVGAGDIEP